MAIGGDHSVTGGILQGLAGASSRLTDGPVALVHLDAHIDTYENIRTGSAPGSRRRTGPSYLVRQGQRRSHRSTQVGIRGNPRTPTGSSRRCDLGYESFA